jgi:hypothetical protein
MAVPGKKALKQFSSSTQSIASDEDLQVFCQPCDEEGTRIPAHGYCTDCNEHLCKNCFTVHKKHKLSKQHTLLDLTKMPKVLHQPSTSTHKGKSNKLSIPCCKHPKEIIKFYCQDHEELLCSVCVTLEHQASSCKFNYIPDISGNITGSKECQDILKAVENTSSQYQQFVEDVKKMTNKSNSSLKEALADIKMFRQEINQRLDELERQIKDAAKVKEQENNKHLKAVETTCKDITKFLKISSDKIKQLNTPKQADQLFMELKLAKKTMKNDEEKKLQLLSYDIEEHNFRANEAILDLLKTEKSLGTLTQKNLNIKFPCVQINSRRSSHEGEICGKTSNDKGSLRSPSVQIRSRQSSHQGEIYVKTSKDNSRCCIRGMTLLTPDLLIIADRNNNAVKMVDTSSQSVSYQLQLDDKPWDVTTVTSTELAVTVPSKQTIQFISISSNKLIKKHNMIMNGQCHGISCNQDKLVVTYCYPGKLQILEMNYTILTTIDDKNMFKEPVVTI